MYSNCDSAPQKDFCSQNYLNKKFEFFVSKMYMHVYELFVSIFSINKIYITYSLKRETTIHFYEDLMIKDENDQTRINCLLSYERICLLNWYVC